MKIVITQWALDSYLELVRHRVFSRQEYLTIIRPDVKLLKNYPKENSTGLLYFKRRAHMTTQVRFKAKESKKHFLSDNKCSISTEQMKLFFIAVQMKKSGLSDLFIVSAVRAALEYEGISDLMNLWVKEEDEKERDEIISDIQEMLEDFSQAIKSEEIYIKFNDLEKIAEDIRGFKDSLYQEVMSRGGISRLAELTGIPQPSLSRFFNSNAMPRRSTVLAIAKALNLDGLALDLKWSK